MSRLLKELLTYGGSQIYPFHMPGHKRNMQGRALADAMKLDITEIEGFDDLHDPRGLILEAQEEASRLYGSGETRFLVNGSTAGILAAVAGCVKKGGSLLMARNCHKSAYHAAMLNELKTVYVYPEMETGFGIRGGIFVSDVERALKAYPDVGAVLIVSPTYDGVVSDVSAIARAAHARGIPLIVDEAHGAHFGFHPGFPDSSVHQGADVVIHSLHKTLPSMTQTALLHLNGDLADREKIKRYLAVYQSSSPSYVLMASIDQCMEILEKEGDKLFSLFFEGLMVLRESLSTLSHIRLAGGELKGRCGIFDYDPSRLLLSVRGTGMTGPSLDESLRTRFGLWPEMASFDYILAITGIMDTEDGFNRLENALRKIDRELEEERSCPAKGMSAPPFPEKPTVTLSAAQTSADAAMTTSSAQTRANPVMSMSAALALAKERTVLSACAGRICAEAVSLYPPGIPVILPGERITEAVRDLLLLSESLGIHTEGLAGDTGREVWVIK